MAPVLTTALTRLRNDFNTIAPNRDKESDGWIGDLAHQQTKSGHNPDESGGGEYEDADTKDEVRAIDVDKDLRVSSLTMQMCINKILATPNDLRRLRYIIFNRVIYSKSDGWRAREYTGSNPHDKHAHFSGDPTADESGEGWSILSLVEEEDMGAAEDTYRLIHDGLRPEGLANTAGGGIPIAWIVRKMKEIQDEQAAARARDVQLASGIVAIGEKVDIDATELEAIKQAASAGAASSAQAIIDGVLAGLPDGVSLSKDDVKAAIRDFYADAVQ